MRKNIILLIIITVSFFGIAFTQTGRFGASKSCNWNANFGLEPDEIKSNVKIIFKNSSGQIDGFCSGTLINRNVDDNDDVRYYMLCARHCVQDVDFSVEHSLAFNYQSPSINNNDVPIYNQGTTNSQSISLYDDGYSCYFNSILNVVQKRFWGDFALIEIESSIPPHFDFYYSGWTPSLIGLSTPFNFFDAYTGIHHPRGDIKKISIADEILILENPVATGCYTVTRVIDVLFGWLWRRRFSTSVVCNYIDNPWVVVPVWNIGIVENGSSGSGLYNTNGRVIGMLSGSTTTCIFPGVTTYGKLRANYSNATVKRTMNPKKSIGVDLWGMSGQYPNYCDKNLDLPGNVVGSVGRYFPAKAYQSNNNITLHAKTINTSAPIIIFDGADYAFEATNSITLSPGFIVQSGATFSSSIVACEEADQEIDNPWNEVFENIIIPDETELDHQKSKRFTNDFSENGDSLLVIQGKVFPNPTQDYFNIDLKLKKEYKSVEIMIYNTNGTLIKSLNYNFVSQISQRTSIENYPPGVYYLKIFVNGQEAISKNVLKIN